jgi:osmoprotectant transport system ATP-binding protein
MTDTGTDRSSQQPGSAIVFHRVTKQYPGPGRPAVSEVSLSVEPGKFVVLLGPSGCGKTTLLKMVNRLIEPTSGRIEMDGEDIQQVDAPALRRRIGYVIQQTGLFPHMRVEENIAVVPKLLRWNKDEIRRRVDELLDLVGLPHGTYRKRYPGQLSGGEQQRVGLARALAVRPSMMLMDEPFGALDAITRSRLQGELLRLHRRLGQTILFVTHDIDEAVRLADEIVVMREGEIVQHGTPLEIVTHPADDFVSDLVGGGDALRRLSLIAAESIMGPVPAGELLDEHAVEPQTDLRRVLDMLLRSGATSVQVAEADGDIVGVVDLDRLWDVASETHERSEIASVR